MAISENVAILTCPLCLNADEADAMVRVTLEHAAFSKYTTLCRLCAYAITLVVTGSGEAAPVSTKDLNHESLSPIGPESFWQEHRGHEVIRDGRAWHCVDCQKFLEDPKDLNHEPDPEDPRAK